MDFLINVAGQQYQKFGSIFGIYSEKYVKTGARLRQ